MVGFVPQEAGRVIVAGTTIEAISHQELLIVLRSVFSNGVNQLNYMMQFLTVGGESHEQSLCQLAEAERPVRQRTPFRMFTDEPVASSPLTTPPRPTTLSSPSPPLPRAASLSTSTATTRIFWLENISHAIAVHEGCRTGLPPRPPSNESTS
jgi:hypothetical protein